MSIVKVSGVYDEYLEFNDGTKMYSEHYQDCCENHYLDFEHLSIGDFEGMEFDLSNDNFFERVPDYGIKLIPVSGGWPVGIPGYAQNNGYYSSNLTLVIEKSDGTRKTYDIQECQQWSDY